MTENHGIEALGLTFASFMNLGMDAALQGARWAEELGYQSYWTAETTGPEAFSTLAAVGAAAPSLDLGTGVLALQLRTPTLVAMAGATLQALHPERDIILGVGISSPVVTSKWHGAPYGERPLARVREYVTLVRECLSGESVSFTGDFYEVSRFRLGVKLGERRPKVVIGALNPGMLQLAGELADGVLLNYLPASHVPWSVEQVRPAPRVARAVRRRSTPTSTPGCASARTASTWPAATCSPTPWSTPTPATSSGPASPTRSPRSGASTPTATARAPSPAVSDRMVDAIDVMGDADHVRATVQSYVDAGVDVPVLMPLPWGPDRLGVVGDHHARRRRPRLTLST